MLTSRRVVTVVAALFGGIVVGAGVAWAAQGLLDDGADNGTQPSIAASPSPSASPSASASPSPSASPSIAPEYADLTWARDVGVDWSSIGPTTVEYDPAAWQRPASFDDGIAAAELPPLAPRVHERYPSAHVLEDWVWDRVGPGWSLMVYSPYSIHSDDHSLRGVPSQMYLVSSEGVHFRLDDRVFENFEGLTPNVLHWWPNRREALVRFGSVRFGEHRTVDLVTGETTLHGRSRDGATTAETLEVWGPFAGGAEIHRRKQTPDTESTSAEVTVERAGESVVLDATEPLADGDPVIPWSGDSAYVLFTEETTEGQESVLVNVDSGTVTPVDPVEPANTEHCRVTGNYGAEGGVLVCSHSDDSTLATAYTVSWDGATSPEQLVGPAPSGSIEHELAWREFGIEVVPAEEPHWIPKSALRWGGRDVVDFGLLGYELGAIVSMPTWIDEDRVIAESDAGVIAIDLDAGEAFLLAPSVIPDTGAPAAQIDVAAATSAQAFAEVS